MSYNETALHNAGAQKRDGCEMDGCGVRSNKPYLNTTPYESARYELISQPYGAVS